MAKAVPKKAPATNAAKPAAKKAAHPVTKALAAPAKKAPAKKAPAAPKKAPAAPKKVVAAKTPAVKTAPAVTDTADNTPARVTTPYDGKFLDAQRKLLLDERAKLVGEAENLEAEAASLM